MMNRTLWVLSLMLWLGGSPGCERSRREGGETPSAETPSAETPPVETPPVETPRSLSLAPSAATLAPGARQHFTATVTGAGGAPVLWTATGGDITAEGLYTAPVRAGTYTVRAQVEGQPSLFAQAPVTVTEAPPPPPEVPTITRFQASPDTIDPGQDTTLSWEVEGATALSVAPVPGGVTGSRVTVHPDKTGTYTLKATNEAGSATATAQVTVREPPVPTWTPLSWAHEQPGNYDSDVYRWLDSGHHTRTAVLTRNEAGDPGGGRGGMLRQFRFQAGAGERVATGTGANGVWNGWGYVASHFGDGNSVVHTGTLPGHYRRAFLGRHHALHEFTWDLNINGKPVKATVHWLFATGKDHPLYAITFDTRAAGEDGLGVSADSRAPYGDIAWDGDGTNAWVDGVKWGDRYRFSTLDEPLTPQSRWTYNEPNAVPYALTYSRTADAEMGIVQTLSWEQHNTGGTWFHNNWKHTSEDQEGRDDYWKMPPNWNWTYQICQYELKDNTSPTKSKRLAWGLMFGAVGSKSYNAYGYGSLLSGHPYQSYAVYMVMGQQSTQSVLGQVTQVEHLLGARLQASQGQVTTTGPGGVGRTDSVSYAVPGYNSTYGAHELQADAEGHFTARLEALAGDIQNPLFLVHAVSGAPAQLYRDGAPLRADVDYFASFDAATSTTWITLEGVWSGGHTLSNTPVAATAQ